MAVILIENSIRSIGTGKGVAANKKAIKVLGVNKTGMTLVGSTILKSGAAEVKTFEIPPDYAFAIGADGEYWVLANEKEGVKISTFKKVYDPTPLTQKTALETAKAAGLVLTPWEVAMQVREDLQTHNTDADISKVEFAYFRASGKGEVFRQPKGTGGNKISKPGWGGDGWQHNGEDAVVLISEASCHCIGKDEFLRDWILTDRPELTKEDLYEAIPVISFQDFFAMQS